MAKKEQQATASKTIHQSTVVQPKSQNPLPVATEGQTLPAAPPKPTTPQARPSHLVQYNQQVQHMQQSTQSVQQIQPIQQIQHFQKIPMMVPMQNIQQMQPKVQMQTFQYGNMLYQVPVYMPYSAQHMNPAQAMPYHLMPAQVPATAFASNPAGYGGSTNQYAFQQQSQAVACQINTQQEVKETVGQKRHASDVSLSRKARATGSVSSSSKK